MAIKKFSFTTYSVCFIVSVQSHQIPEPYLSTPPRRAEAKLRIAVTLPAVFTDVGTSFLAGLYNEASPTEIKKRADRGRIGPHPDLSTLGLWFKCGDSGGSSE
ncbi:MAG: hypothetical protein E7237_05105 [Sarcina sp.]|nr:hypothetical protein [Sarcina sp.]